MSKRRLIPTVAGLASPLLGYRIATILEQLAGSNRPLQWIALVGPSFMGMALGIIFTQVALDVESIEKEEKEENERASCSDRERPVAYRRGRVHKRRSGKTA